MHPFSDRSLAGIAMLIAGYFSYTVGDVLIKMLSARYPVFEVVGLIGLVFMGVTLAAVIHQHRIADLRAKRPGLLLVRGLLNSGHSALVFYGFAHLPIVNVYAFLFAAPVFLTLLSILFLHEQVGWRRWLAVLAGFIGILIMLRPGTMHMSWGLLAVALTPITSSIGMLLVRLASRTEKTPAIALYSAGGNAVVAGLVMLPSFIMPNLIDWLMFMAAGALNAAGLILIVRGFNRTGTPLGAPFQYTQLLWGTLAGWLVWNHLPDFWMYIGAVVVGGSGLFTFYRELIRGRTEMRDADQSVANEIIGDRKV
jgi:drug/metabolite transporter (DMT)-like permease